MAKFLGIDKLFYLMKVVKETGGVKAAFMKLYRMDELKVGTLVGTDKFGNKYFENKRYFYSRNRWVEYAPYYHMDYDGSQVPAEWFGWLHYKTDLTPDKDPARLRYKWMMDHTENLSGTRDAFYPYSTTLPKVEPWIPPKK